MEGANLTLLDCFSGVFSFIDRRKSSMVIASPQEQQERGILAMLVVVKGKNLELTDALRNYTEQKIGKLDRYLDNITEASVELSFEQTRSVDKRFVAQVTMDANGTILRAEEKSGDLYSAIDMVIDVMQNQVVRFKGKLIGSNRTSAAKVAPIAPPIEGELRPVIVRTKRFAIKPMEVEEAVEQMELLSHDFFMFHNAATDEINVVYKRKDGNYGLIEPKAEEEEEE
jgi:putative sigma-54 modulation protein